MSRRKNNRISSKESALPGVSERAIEHWLAKVSERGYQTAFCQLLNAMGYTMVHSTTHGAAEEGKDVIALDTKHQPIAFQLKRGKISLSAWRKMKSEVEELVEQPINPTYVRSRKWHRAVLVTTGSIHEEAARRIDGLNRKWRQNFRPLEIWKGDELLRKFLKHSGRFLPSTIPEFHRLLGFMIADGHGLLDKVEFDRFLRSILPIDISNGPSRARLAHVIPASAIVVEYALAGFDRAENNFARIEAYTMLTCYILALAERLALSEHLWRPTLNNLENAVDRYAELLADEAVALGSFGQGSPFTDQIVAPYRAAITAGALSAHGLWYSLGGKSRWYSAKAVEVRAAVKRLSQKTQIPSEAAVPAFFLTSQYLRHSGAITTGDSLFRRLLYESVLRKQGKPGIKPLWGPYLPFEEAILRDLGKPADPHDKEAWEDLSYTAWPLVLIAVRRMLRHDLERLWYPNTSMQFTEIVPSKDWQRLLWHVGQGTMLQRMVPQPTSWSKLRREADCLHRIPKSLTRLRHWLPYYLLIYPHRFTAASVIALDKAIR